MKKIYQEPQMEVHSMEVELCQIALSLVDGGEADNGPTYSKSRSEDLFEDEDERGGIWNMSF